MPEMDVHLFGYPEFLIDGHLIQFERRKTAALLAYLIVETYPTGHPVAGISRETLSTLFWPECSQEQAGAYLRQSLWEFTRLAGETWIIRNNRMISLDFTASIRVDIHLFESLYQPFKKPGNRENLPDTWLSELSSLYRGDFLAGFTLKNCPDFDNWQALHTETLRLHMTQALQEVTQLNISWGEYPQAETNARKWLALDQLNEAAHRMLMQIYEQSGRHSAALLQYETCRSILMDELGVEPDPQTLTVYRQICERKLTVPASVVDLAPSIPALGPNRNPSGTVTFIFTDIQGSTDLWEHHKEAMQHAFHRHEEIVRCAMVSHGGFVYKMIGDAFQVAFATATDALLAALEAQQNLHHESWDVSIAEIKVRMALHTGVTEERGDDYVGPVLNRVARLLSAGHGGQVLLTEATYQLLREETPAGIKLEYLGEYHLKDLLKTEKIYQVTAPGLPTNYPPLRADNVRTWKLPTQSTSFIGRETELVRINEMLNEPACHLITLIGIGGCGKTRLAIRAAERSQGFQDGICFCALENVDTLQGLILAIAESVDLAFSEQPGSSITIENAREQLFHYLAGKQRLLVLDNFEQLSSCTMLVNDLLNASTEIKVLVTSRQRLNLPGEWVLEVGGLSFPGDLSSASPQKYSAVQLFVSTAVRNTTFQPRSEDWHAIMKICQLLEGIPLGLEMAASWTRLLSCAEIAGEIEKNQDFLSSSWRGMPDRHRTLRAVFEHSWRLLSGAEQAVFIQLSIFQGGFSREAALIVAEAPLQLMSSLTDKVLIRRISSDRFEIHPLLGQYAAEKLTANPTFSGRTHSRLAGYYTDWLMRMFEKLKGKEHLASLTAIRDEAANLVSSMEWLVDQVDVTRLSSFLPAWILYQLMNDRRFEMQQAGQLIVRLVNCLRPKVRTSDNLDAGLLALACAAARIFCIDYTNPSLIEPYRRESFELIKNSPDHINKAYALLLNCIGPGYFTPSEAIDWSHQCISIFEKVGDPWGTAMAFLVLGDVTSFGNCGAEDTQAAYERGLEGFTHLGSDWGRALCASGLMFLDRNLGNLEEAYQLGTSSLAIYAEMGNDERMAPIRECMAEVAQKLGYLSEARSFHQANMAHFARRGDEKTQQFFQKKLAELDGTRSII